MKQVITIYNDGSVFGLDHKRKGLDLTKLGKATKQRVSDVRWDEEHQEWFIALIAGQFSGRVVNETLAKLSGVPWWNLQGVTIVGDVLLFGDYEDAVAAEVAILQGLQKKSLFE